MSNTLHILHPSSRKDRYELLIPQLESQGIEDYVLWDNRIGQSMEDRKTCVNLGHKKIVQYAKDNNLESIIIAENDLTFTDKGAWDYYLKNTPKSYDLYLGMIYSGKIKDNKLDGESCGFTMYRIHQKFYDFFLNTPNNGHIDRIVTKHFNEFDFYVCDKFVCYQNDTQSDNYMGKMNLSMWLKGRDMFTSQS